jgi:hypothetical protein
MLKPLKEGRFSQRARPRSWNPIPRPLRGWGRHYPDQTVAFSGRGKNYLLELLLSAGSSPCPAQVNNKQDEAQQAPRNPFCGVDVREEFHWNSIVAFRAGNGLRFT